MFHDFNYPSILAASSRAAWEIEDVIPAGARLDFTRPFMPDALARTAGLAGLSEDERRILNQIRGHDYLSIFGLVEEFILPFVLDHARPQLSGDDERVRALLNFASGMKGRVKSSLAPAGMTSSISHAAREEAARIDG